MKQLLTAFSLLILSSTAYGDALFPPKSQVDEQAYEKSGEKRYIYKGFFKVYDAALYTEPEAAPAEVLSGDYCFKLKFNYLRDIDKARAIEAADQALARNLEPDELSSIAARIDEINDIYRSVEKGDTTLLVYEPEIGTSYYFNGEKLVTIPGKDFASLYFRIWLGEDPLSDRLRDALLGNS